MSGFEAAFKECVMRRDRDRARIAELEATLLREQQGAEAAVERIGELETALAERDRMLRLAWEEGAHARWYSLTDGLYDDWLADLRARAGSDQ